MIMMSTTLGLLLVLLTSPVFGMGMCKSETMKEMMGKYGMSVDDGKLEFNKSPKYKCSYGAKYRITFYNALTRANPNFTEIVPPSGLVYSPMTGVSHTSRSSLFTVGGYATKGLEMVCETGNNLGLRREAYASGMVSSVDPGNGPVPAGGSNYVTVFANCQYSRLTVVSMIAPSPDWIVQINAVPLVEDGYFVDKRYGPLFAYDCGTDDSGDFTDPADTSLDKPTLPRKNIALLSSDETDPFGKQPVGFYVVEKM